MIGTIAGQVGKPLSIMGYANDFDRRIQAVQFSLDDGETWTSYETPGTVADKNLYWKFEYTPVQSGSYQLLVRSVNEEGAASPSFAAIDFVVN